MQTNIQSLSIIRSLSIAVVASSLFSACAVGTPRKETSSNDALNAVLWTQTAFEYRAVTMAAYAAATDQLDAAIKDHSWTAAIEQTGRYGHKPPAIILDIDGTVLSTKPYQSWRVTTGVASSCGAGENLERFLEQETLNPLPGAIRLTTAAADKGVAVFYVTNRSASEKELSITNLRKLGFPNADADHVLTQNKEKGWGYSKSSRRATIAAKYRIIMLFGDDLNDFVDTGGKNIAERIAIGRRYTQHWRTHRWVALPNPVYGSWEAAPYNNDCKKSPQEMQRDKLNSLRPWAGPQKP